MRSLRLFFVVTILVVAILFGRAEFSFSRDRPRQFTMENGVKVILEENRATPVVALQVWVKVGSADEKDEEAGMCHFVEHMLFKGTEKRKVREMAKEIESLGGTMNAYTSYDNTVYHVTIASRYAATGLDILSDLVQHPTFDSSELEREREVILEEIRRGEDNPSRRLFNQTMATLYQHHPYGRPVTGYERTVRAITRDQMVSFFKKWYVPSRMVFIVTGDFDLDTMGEKVGEAFGGMKPSSKTFLKRVKEPERAGVRSVVSQGHVKETYLQIGFPISSAKDEDAPALDAFSYILGRGEGSRLVQEVKLEKGLVNTISAFSYTLKDPGLFIVDATLPAENVEKAIEAILEGVSRLRREGVTPEELHRVKVNIESDLVYGRQTVQGMAGRIGFYEVIAGDVQFEEEYMRRVALLQSEDIQEVLRKYFQRERLIISILAPDEKAEGIRTLSLKSIAEREGLSGESAEKKVTISRTILDNGIRLIIKENPSLPVVTLQVSFLGGVRFEEAAQNGINHFIAVMWTTGTRNRSNLQITKKVERMAGSLNGFSGYNSLGLTFTFLSQHFEDAFSLLTEVIRQPSFDKEEVEKRRRLILSSIRQQEDDLARLVFKLFRKTLYEKHPYRMDTLGTVDSVQRLTQKDLKEYYQRIVAPENMVVTVAGDVDQRRVLAAVKQGFGDLKRTSFHGLPVSQESPVRKKRQAEMAKMKEQAHFILGFLGATIQHPDSDALRVLGAALSGQGGRLFRELRDNESLAYALSFMAQPDLDPGFIGVYMGTHPRKLETAIEAVLRELKKVKEEGLTEEEMERAKKYLIGNFEIGLQTNEAQANQVSLDELYGLGFDHYQKYPREIERVTKEDVGRVARKYLDLDSYVLAVVRPPLDKKE